MKAKSLPGDNTLGYQVSLKTYDLIVLMEQVWLKSIYGRRQECFSQFQDTYMNISILKTTPALDERQTLVYPKKMEVT